MDVPTKQAFAAETSLLPFDWFAPRHFGHLRIAARGVSPRATLGTSLIRSDAASLTAWPSSRGWTPHDQQHEARNEHQAWYEECATLTAGGTLSIRAIRPCVTAFVPFVTHHSCRS